MEELKQVNNSVYYKCTKCEGIFIITVIKDSRNYIPYFYNCVFCGNQLDRRHFEVI